jgi:hypothetical protein
MPKKMVIKIGDTIGYPDNRTATIEKIRMVSKGEFIEECKYGGEEDDIVLTLRDGTGTIDLWLKNNPIRLLESKKETKKP